MTDQERAIQRFKGQYLQCSDKKPKVKPKGNELQRINLCYFNRSGKTANRSGAL